MIRLLFAFAIVCLLSKISFAQPMLVPPTPADATGSAPSFSAPPVPHINHQSEQFNTTPVQDYQAPATQYDSAPSYQSAPSYESPSYESHSTPAYEVESSPSYDYAPVQEYAPSYESNAANYGCADCQNGNSSYAGAPAASNYFIGQSYSTFGSIPPSSSGDYTHSYMGGASSAGVHARNPYYSYRHSWFTPGPVSQNVTIAW